MLKGANVRLLIFVIPMTHTIDLNHKTFCFIIIIIIVTVCGYSFQKNIYVYALAMCRSISPLGCQTRNTKSFLNILRIKVSDWSGGFYVVAYYVCELTWTLAWSCHCGGHKADSQGFLVIDHWLQETSTVNIIKYPRCATFSSFLEWKFALFFP